MNVATGATLSAVVRFNGTLVRGRGVTQPSTGGIGSDDVTFDRDASSYSSVTTPGRPDSTGGVSNTIASVASLAFEDNGVFVRIQDTGTTLVNEGFHLVVIC